MNWKKIIIANTAIMSMVITSPAIGAPNPLTNNDANQSSKTEQLESIKEELNTVEKDIAHEKEGADQLADDKQKAYEEWQSQTVQIADLEMTIHQHTSDLLQARDRVYNLEKKEIELKDDLDKRKLILGKRLQSMQEEKISESILAILLNSQNFTDFINRTIAVSEIIDSDQALIDSINQEKERYTAIKEDAQAELDRIDEIKRELDNTKVELTFQREKKNQYVEVLNNQYGWKVDNIKSLQDQYGKLKKRSDDLQQEITQENQESGQVNPSQGNDYAGGGGYDVRNVSDVSAEELENVLKGRLSGYGDVFYQTGHQYGIDPAFLAAIAMAETGGDSKWLRNYNNVGGFIYNGPMTFASIEDSISYMGSLLTRLYIGDGLYTVEAIHSRYSPVGASNDPTNLNSNWVRNVYKFLGEAGVV